MKIKLQLIATLFLAFAIQNNIAQWTQKGQSLNGATASENFGFTVSISTDGQSIVTAAPYSSHPGFGVGHVQIYKSIGGTWIQQGQDLIGNNQGDNFGFATSISSDGSIVAISAPNNDDILNNAGIVNVYENINGTWTQLGQSIVGSSAGDKSGKSVSLSEDGLTVAIGTPSHASGALGQVRVFQYTGGSWIQLGSDVNGLTNQSQLGTSVNLSADGLTFITGLRASTFDTLTYNGSAKVFEYNGTDWTQKGATIQGEAANDNAGIAVDISTNGNIIAVGASKHDGTASNAGQVRLFEYAGGVWSQIGQDIDGEAINNEFGTSLSLSDDGSIIAVGASKNAGGGTVAGHTRIYENIGGNWIQKGIDIDGVAYDQSGSSVGLSGDGASVIIGAPYNSDTVQYAGQVKVYEFLSSVNIESNAQIEKVKIYPNPTSGQFYLESTLNYEQKVITILNVQGQIVEQLTTSNNMINISHLESGVYFLQVKIGNAKTTKKIIKD